MELKIKRVVIICQPHHQDEVHMTIDGETPYPELSESYPGEYEPTFRVTCRKGYAEEWCSKMGIQVDHIVNA